MMTTSVIPFPKSLSQFTVPELDAVRSATNEALEAFGPDLDRTGEELAAALLASLPDPFPAPRFPGLVADALERAGRRSVLVSSCGYANISRGCRRVESWMAGQSFPHPERYPQVGAGLGISPERLASICRHDKVADFMEHQRMRAQVPAYQLVVYFGPMVADVRSLAPELTFREALYSAREHALRTRRWTSLNTPACISVRFSNYGSVGIEAVYRGTGLVTGPSVWFQPVPRDPQ